MQAGNIETAEHYFSAILDGYNFDSRSDGFFGLGVIHYRKSKDEGFSQEIRKTYSNNSLSFFKEAKSSKNQNISKKSAKYFDLLLKESTSLTQQNSPAPTLLSLHNAQRSQSEPPEAESSSKRARKDGWN